MNGSAKRLSLVAMIGAVAVMCTACGPGAAEGLLNAYLSVAGPIIGVGLLVLIALGGIPKP